MFFKSIGKTHPNRKLPVFNYCTCTTISVWHMENYSQDLCSQFAKRDMFEGMICVFFFFSSSLDMLAHAKTFLICELTLIFKIKGPLEDLNAGA